jgi:hypothetical protein
MFIANSLEYDIQGFDVDSKMWVLIGKPTDEDTKQVMYINKAKFVDKANGLAYFLDSEGRKSLTYASQLKLQSIV